MARGARWLLDPPATVQPSWESWSEPWVERLPEWARDPAFWSAVTVVSVIVSVGGLSLAIVALPRFLTRVPPDYFLGRRHPSGTSPGSRAVRFFRNAAGSLLIALGVLLLVLPGPGYLTILAGVIIVNFTWKYRVGRWILRKRGIRRAVDKLRRKAGKEPLLLREGELAGDAEGSDSLPPR